MDLSHQECIADLWEELIQFLCSRHTDNGPLIGWEEERIAFGDSAASPVCKEFNNKIVYVVSLSTTAALSDPYSMCFPTIICLIFCFTA